MPRLGLLLQRLDDELAPRFAAAAVVLVEGSEQLVAERRPGSPWEVALGLVRMPGDCQDARDVDFDALLFLHHLGKLGNRRRQQVEFRGLSRPAAKALQLEKDSAVKLQKMGVKIVDGVDKSGFVKIASPYLEKMAKDLGPHAAKIQQLVSAIK